MRARGRRTALLAAKGIKVSQSTKKANTPRVIKFNMNTYKLHALADYPAYIRLMGTTDNYSTQMVSSLFSSPKIFLTESSTIKRESSSTSVQKDSITVPLKKILLSSSPNTYIVNESLRRYTIAL